MYLTPYPEVAAGARKLTPPEISALVKEEWKSMTADEKAAIVADATPDVEARRESKHLGSHNVPIASFHDFRQTMDSIANQVCRLFSST